MRQVRVRVADALDDGDLSAAVSVGELGEVGVEADGRVECDRRGDPEGRPEPRVRGVGERHDRGEAVVPAAELDDDEGAIVAPAEPRRGGLVGRAHRP